MTWHCNKCGHSWKPKAKRIMVEHGVYEYKNMKTKKCPECGSTNFKWVF